MTRGSWYRLPDMFDKDLRLLLYSISLRRISMGFLGIVRAIYFALLGLSPFEIGILLSIDWLLDRFRTSVNVWGDCVGAAVVHARLDKTAVESA